MEISPLRKQAEAIWHAGVAAVGGSESVTASLAGGNYRFDLILGVGKAAVPMCEAALPNLVPGGRALAVTKYGHSAGHDSSSSVLEIIEAAHPVPDENSLAGGRALLEAVSGAAPGSRLLLLVSGGASSLAEALNPGATLEMLQARNSELVSSGLDIHAINAERRKLSRIKGGGLLSTFAGGSALVLAISDVSGDDIAVIGSGIGALADGSTGFESQTRIVASNAIARRAAAKKTADLGLAVLENAEALYGDVDQCAEQVAEVLLQGEPGVYIFGGEPVIQLPDNPGTGGRNQALAAEIARRIAGVADICVLVGGTDGTDGPTAAAGGIVDGTSWSRAPSGADAIARADSGTWLQAAGALFTTGPTGTNVMDLLVAVKAGQ